MVAEYTIGTAKLTTAVFNAGCKINSTLHQALGQSGVGWLVFALITFVLWNVIFSLITTKWVAWLSLLGVVIIIAVILHVIDI